MFQSLRPGNTIYVLRKDSQTLEIGSIVSVSAPMPKYQMQPMFNPTQEMVVDIVARLNNQDITYQKLPANLDIADFGSNGIVISDNREAINSEIISMRNKSMEIINSADYHKKAIENYNKILNDINPEFAEKQEQQKEINMLRTKMDEMAKSMENLMATNQKLILALNKEKNDENVGN